MSPRIPSVLLAAYSCVFTACSHDFRLMRLEERLGRYGDALRWGQFLQLAEFKPQGASPLAAPNPLDEVTISSYTPLYRQEMADGRQLIQTVDIRYVKKTDLAEHRLIDQQRWRYDDGTGTWMLDSDWPRFE